MRWYAIGYGDLLALIKPQFSTIDAPILDALIAIIVQLTFCWRIRVLSKSWLLSGSIALVAVAQLVGALASAILVRLSFLPPPFILLSTFSSDSKTPKPVSYADIIFLGGIMVRRERIGRYPHRGCDDHFGSSPPPLRLLPPTLNIAI